MKYFIRLFAPAALALGLALSAANAAQPGLTEATTQPDRVPHREKRAFPPLLLPERAASGQRAIDLLRDRIGEVADFYGKSADELKAQLLNDHRVRIDQRGRLFAVDELETPLPAGATTAQAATTGLIDGTLAPLDQTFLLHSRPGAKRTIYLNFKGATLTGTAWNSAGGSIIAPPYDIDGVPGTFSTAELQRIQYIWQRVAEDYAAFDVNVTTEAVPLDRITRSGTADDTFGTTVLITKRAGVYSCSCGGVAYLGVFDDTSEFYKPALVFYDALGSGNEKYVAEAISHEAGHNMGLGHDGTATAGYYTGHGSAATGWAPIMGVGYYQALVQWSKGEYTGANNAQDDYAVMQGNGLPLRTDDHGNTAATATALTGTAAGATSTASAQGVIERPTDVDVFAFTAAAGNATFTLSPAARSSNLDALVTVRNAAGATLATANPVDALNASVTIALPAAGTYYVFVQGTGKGDPLTTGYSNYGSLGQYALNVSYSNVVVTNQAPVARITTSTVRGTAPLAVNFSGTGSTDADGSIASYAWTFGDGGSATGATASRSYTTPGSYTAQLTVTDNGGLTNATSVTITVDAPVVVPVVRVADIAMSLQGAPTRGQAFATAAVKLVDANGLPVVNATVRGDWSGIAWVVGQTAVTDSAGIARFQSTQTRQFGTFVFTVTSVSHTSYTYAPATNTETADSIQR